MNANITFRTPQNFGPAMSGLHPLGGWTASFLPTWITGSYFTWNPLGKLHLQDNLQWPDYYVWDMKVSKNFQVNNVGFEAYLNVSNLFNNKVTHFNRAFSSGSDEREYLASLKLPMYDSPEFDELRTSSPEGYYAPGDDKPGDVRSDDKPYINDPNEKLWLFDQTRDIWFGVVVRF